jgi:hypothetical protein
MRKLRPKVIHKIGRSSSTSSRSTPTPSARSSNTVMDTTSTSTWSRFVKASSRKKNSGLSFWRQNVAYDMLQHPDSYFILRSVNNTLCRTTQLEAFPIVSYGQKLGHATAKLFFVSTGPNAEPWLYVHKVLGFSGSCCHLHRLHLPEKGGIYFLRRLQSQSSSSEKFAAPVT